MTRSIRRPDAPCETYGFASTRVSGSQADPARLAPSAAIKRRARFPRMPVGSTHASFLPPTPRCGLTGGRKASAPAADRRLGGTSRRRGIVLPCLRDHRAEAAPRRADGPIRSGDARHAPAALAACPRRHEAAA